MKSQERLYEKLRPGDAIYYASTLQMVTTQTLLFMSKTHHKGFYEAIDITPNVAKRFKFVPDATESVWQLNFNEHKIVNLYFEGKTLIKIRIRLIYPTDALKWDFKPLQFHELQQMTDILLNESYHD